MRKPVVGGITLGGYQVDLSTHAIHGVDGTTYLDARSSELLRCLLTSRGSVVSRAELIERVWGGRPVGDYAIDSAISRLRSALGDCDKQLVRTVPKKGYILEISPASTGEVSALCVRGEASLDLWAPEPSRLALSCFESVCRLDPGNARALAGAALARAWLCCYCPADITTLRAATAEADQARLCAPLLSSSLLARGVLDFLQGCDAQLVSSALNQALSLSPGSVAGLVWRSQITLATADFDNAVCDARCAAHLDRHNAGVRGALVATLFIARRYRECASEADRAVEDLGSLLGFVAYKGLALAFADDADEAVRVMAQSWRPGAGRSERLRELQEAFNAGGLPGYFRRMAEASSSANPDDVIRPVDRAALWALSGNRKRALALLQLAADRGDLRLRWIAVLPQLDGLRGWKPFEALCAEHAPRNVRSRPSLP